MLMREVPGLAGVTQHRGDILSTSDSLREDAVMFNPALCRSSCFEFEGAKFCWPSESILKQMEQRHSAAMLREAAKSVCEWTSSTLWRAAACYSSACVASASA